MEVSVLVFLLFQSASSHLCCSDRYVLSNHYLFQLADRPPADMAALLASFQSLPPLIRKRSKELLDTIRAAVKRGLGDQQTLVAPTGLQDNTLNVSPAEESSSSHLDTTPAPRLWAQNTALPLAAATSTLFDLSRSTGPIAAFSNHYSTARSSLLSDSVSSTSAIVPSRATRAGFQSILKKIHTSLVIVPALPNVRRSPDMRFPNCSYAYVLDHWQWCSRSNKLRGHSSRYRCYLISSAR